MVSEVSKLSRRPKGPKKSNIRVRGRPKGPKKWYLIFAYDYDCVNVSFYSIKGIC